LNKKPIPQEEIDCLIEMGNGIGRPYLAAHESLCKRGLIEILKGRFGKHTRITEAGRSYLSRMESQEGGRAAFRQQVALAPVKTKPASNRDPVAAPGLSVEIADSTEGTSFRGAGPRTRRTPAKQAAP
jgi:hypothetical protein